MIRLSKDEHKIKNKKSKNSSDQCTSYHFEIACEWIVRLGQDVQYLARVGQLVFHCLDGTNHPIVIKYGTDNA